MPTLHQASDMVSEGIAMAVHIDTLDDYPDLIVRRLGERHMVICAAPAYQTRKGWPRAHANLPAAYPQTFNVQ